MKGCAFQVRFKCESCGKSGFEVWEGFITKQIKHEGYLEIMIESRSSIMALLGKTSRGYFACMPDYGVGCHLTDFRDMFWNTEKLVEILGLVDGITVASAVRHLADKN